MERRPRKISALEVSRINTPGKHPLGDNLYLQVSPAGTKSWLFRFSKHGKTTWMGLGSARLVSLAEARTKAFDHLRSLANGIDPKQAKLALELEQRTQEAKLITFNQCSRLYIDSHEKGWKNEKHKSQWENTIKTYASPVFGELPVQMVDTALVLKVLEPIWHSKTETASRLRGRIERILSWAAVRGYRNGENPARWRGHLDELLPARATVQKTEHFKALPYQGMYNFMEELRRRDGVSIRALEFAILTCTRTNETLNATWDEINIPERHWLIPAERMKAKRPHKIPLTDRTLEILNQMRSIAQSQYIFPGSRSGRPLSNMALLEIVRRMNLDITVHGFRSAFQDWAAERTGYSQEVIDMALAHIVKGKTERAYRRGDLFEKRQKLMADWAYYCSRPPERSVVIDINNRLAQ